MLRYTGWMLNQFQFRGASSPIPTEFSGELMFAGGVSAGFYCSFLTGIEQWANVSGSPGHLEISDFVLPLAGKESTFRIHKSAKMAPKVDRVAPVQVICIERRYGNTLGLEFV